MKLIIAATTEFGIPTFDNLKNRHEIVLVITQPDRPVGRKQIITASPVKTWALSNNFKLIQPEKILDAQTAITGASADLMLVAAYGQLIPLTILNTPKLGSVNIHGSLLPKYRGASPIQAAILNGETETGITLIRMDEKMDHGPILFAAKTPIQPDETFTSLYQRLAELSAQTAPAALEDYAAGNLHPTPQDDSRATFCGLLKKEHGRLHWTDSARLVHQKVLALNPEPGTWTTLDDKSVKILKTQLLTDNKIELAGKLYRHGSDLAVKCADSSLKILELQPEGKRPMTGSEFLNGLQNLTGKMFI
jgi:methionyl-tRNA formyltransferase